MGMGRFIRWEQREREAIRRQIEKEKIAEAKEAAAVARLLSEETNHRDVENDNLAASCDKLQRRIT
jgi:hypothetical protein